MNEPPEKNEPPIESGYIPESVNDVLLPVLIPINMVGPDRQIGTFCINCHHATTLIFHADSKCINCRQTHKKIIFQEPWCKETQ